MAATHQQATLTSIEKFQLSATRVIGPKLAPAAARACASDRQNTLACHTGVGEHDARIWPTNRLLFKQPFFKSSNFISQKPVSKSCPRIFTTASPSAASFLARVHRLRARLAARLRHFGPTPTQPFVACSSSCPVKAWKASYAHKADGATAC